MKPVKLIINAFGPFVTKQEIDFGEISGEEIFLVTGETGAGKTTVFDAISFALYGNASGDNRKSNSFKSDHAALGELCYVEFEFSLRGRKFLLRRSPAQRGIKRDGSHKDIAPNSELTLPDGEIVTGPTAVTERIERILGLNYRQFKQTIMLAQGEFMQFIEANGKEKQQIFSKIFGTSIYSDLTERLIRIESDLQRASQSLRENITRCLHELAGYGHTPLAGPDAAFLPYAQIEDIVTGAISLHEANSARLDVDIAELEAIKLKQNPEQAKALNAKLDRRDALRCKNDELAAQKQEMSDCEERVKRLTAALELEGQEKIILELKKQSAGYDEQITRLEAELAALSDQEQLLFADHDKKTLELERAESLLIERESQYDALYRAFLGGQAGILAAGLKDNEACPVCGSVHHPLPAVAKSDTPTEKSVNDAKNAAALAANKVEAQREKEKKAYWQARTDREKCAARLDATKAHRDGLFAKFIEQRSQFKEKLFASGFESYADYEKTLGEKAKLAGLKRKSEDYHRQCVETAAQLSELERDTQGRTHEDVDTLIKTNDELDRKLSAMREEKSELYASLAGSKKRLAELKDLHGRSFENDCEYAIAHELATLAKGNRTVSFERYILSSYFDDIIKLSNIHLQRMTGSRYTLRRLDDEKRGAGSGLDIIITDSYTGRERDISTLSGGEGFKASLALALGLSGVVQIYSGGVSIDTMFIDEGFGSLDEKSLDSAIETLISLKKSGRMVGIISHVPSLREYIPKKLAVRYSPTGSTVGWI